MSRRAFTGVSSENLLEFDDSAGFFKFLLEFSGFFGFDFFLDGFRGLVDEAFGFDEA